MRRLAVFVAVLVAFAAPAVAEFWNLAHEAKNLLASEAVFDNGGTPWPFFNQIAAENYDLGGQGIAFSVWQNPGCGATLGTYRADSVNFYTPSDTGLAYRVGCMKVGDYLKYTVNVPVSGPYTISIRAAAQETGGSWAVSIDNTPIATLAVPNTGSTFTFTTVTTPSFNATPGNHIIKLQAAAVGVSGIAPDLASFQGAQVSGGTPAQAAAAGFTTQALNADFTIVGGAFSNTATYIDNCGATATYRFYLTLFVSVPGGGGVPNGLPCNATAITTDGGIQVLHMQAPANQYYELHWPGYWLKSDGLGMPNETYQEIVFRTTNATLVQDGSSSFFFSIIDMWRQGRGVTSSGTFPPGEWNETDFLEVTGINNTINNWGGGLITVQNNTLMFGPVTHSTNDLTQYHKLGVLTTSDESTNYWKCTWMDDVFIQCINQLQAAAISYLQHDNSMVIDLGTGGPTLNGTGNTISDLYIKSIKIWECPNWQTATCPGTMVDHWPFP